MTGPVVVDIAGTALTAADRRRLRHPLVGMVILFARNYESAEQLCALTAEIRALRTPPLLVAVDHEGGRVQRFRTPPFTRLPPMGRLGALWEEDPLLAWRAAAAAGYVMAAELRAHGIDFSFAPVLDLDRGRSAVIGDRALHGDARVVTILAGQVAQGMSLAGMAACGKHFPGHGWAAADSHVDLPIDERPLPEILASDAAPYRWLDLTLAAVMPAHVVYPRVDDQPAGFSARWIRGILRRRLRFSGAVFSDDLSMQAAKVAGGIGGRARAALDAGCDFVLVCNDAPAADQLLAALRWRRSPAFDRRRAALVPRGAAPSLEALRRLPQYRSARAALARLAAAGRAAA